MEKNAKFVSPEYPRRNRVIQRYNLGRVFVRNDFYLQNDEEVLGMFFTSLQNNRQTIRLPILSSLPSVEIDAEFVKNARIALTEYMNITQVS